MKKYFSLITFLFLITLFSACKDECSNITCPKIIDTQKYLIKNASGANLLSGPSKAYLAKQLSFRPLRNTTENIYFSMKLIGSDSTIIINDSTLSEKLYLFINNNFTDSIQVLAKSQTAASSCCNPDLRLNGAKVNNGAAQSTLPYIITK